MLKKSTIIINEKKMQTNTNCQLKFKNKSIEGNIIN